MSPGAGAGSGRTGWPIRPPARSERAADPPLVVAVAAGPQSRRCRSVVETVIGDQAGRGDLALPRPSSDRDSQPTRERGGTPWPARRRCRQDSGMAIPPDPLERPPNTTFPRPERSSPSVRSAPPHVRQSPDSPGHRPILCARPRILRDRRQRRSPRHTGTSNHAERLVERAAGRCARRRGKRGARRRPRTSERICPRLSIRGATPKSWSVRRSVEFLTGGEDQAARNYRPALFASSEQVTACLDLPGEKIGQAGFQVPATSLRNRSSEV